MSYSQWVGVAMLAVPFWVGLGFFAVQHGWIKTLGVFISALTITAWLCVGAYLAAGGKG